MASMPSSGREPWAARALDGHVEPDEALVGEGELEMAGLGDDRGVGFEVARHLLRAEAGIFLVGDAGDEDVAREAHVARRAAATIMAATPPFMSKEPRP